MKGLHSLMLPLAAASLLAAPSFFAAEPDDSWHLSLEPYVWIPTLTADTGAKGVSSDVDKEFPGTLDELEAAFMLNAEIRKARWGVLIDGLHLRISGDSPTADIGGFGVGSDLTWQLFGGVGYQCTRNVEVEAGWRYLAIDYDDDGMVFDATVSGLILGLGFKI
jgi:opacity protein-like surface antigen